ncbi:uncharacterized protein UTRI_04313 [Ustilago trichophora]|uniref:Uncharacterized protein n=1 Tax=Ustilago trichophora TaxID=86804 RepID=A0A5C3ET54_9BASI|nr:uncharacterized protein UTRI_04313 [Ustilago trichophora]
MVVYFSLLLLSCLLQATIALGPNADEFFGGLEVLDDVYDLFGSHRPPQSPAPYSTAHASNAQSFHQGSGMPPRPQAWTNAHLQQPYAHPQHQSPNPYPQHPVPNSYPQHWPNAYPQHPSPNPYPQHPSPNPYPQHPDPNSYPQHWPNAYPQHPSPNPYPQHPSPNPYPQHWPAAHPEQQPSEHWNQPLAQNIAHYPPGHANPQTPQHWNYPENREISPPTAAGHVPSQGGSHDPWQSIRQHDLPFGSSQSHTISQPESSGPLDDLYNQLFETSKHGVPSTFRSTPSTSSSASELLAHDGIPSSVQPEQHQLTSTPAEIPHNPPGSFGSTPIRVNLLQPAAPLQMSGKTISFLYEEEEQKMSTKLVEQLKGSNGKGKLWSVDYPRAMSSTSGFLERYRTSLLMDKASSDRPFLEQFFAGRRFLIRLERALSNLDKELKGESLVVWEIKSDGDQAVMVCRGVHSFPHKLWTKLQTPDTVSYILRIAEVQPDRLMVRRAVPEDLQLAGGRSRLLLTKLEINARPHFWANTYRYAPDPDAMSAFEEWLKSQIDAHGGRKAVTLKTKELQDHILERIVHSFEKGNAMFQIELNGQTYLLARYGGEIPGGQRYNSYATLWRQEVRGRENILVLVGVRPMTPKVLKKAIGDANLKEHRFSHDISDQQGSSLS